MPKIVFIVNSLQNQRCIKRISEFIAEGGDVEVYAFSRQKDNYSNLNFPIYVLGTIDPKQSYIRRFPFLCGTIRKVVNDIGRKREDIFYLFGLDIVMAFRFVDSKHRYVYEESDLVHTYVSNRLLKSFLEIIDKRLIKESLYTVLTSEGFAQYHFGDSYPTNVVIIPNKLNPSIMKLDWNKPKIREKDKLRIGFVGKPRFKSVVSFGKIMCSLSERFELHIYGGPILEEMDGFESLMQYKNYFYHGPFKNPEELPSIYSSIDIVLSTYDAKYENVKYAEPNKIYESIFFTTPIVVTSGTFLSKKVEKLGIGYSVDPFNEEDVKSLLLQLDMESMEKKEMNCRRIDKKDVIDSNHEFISALLELK